MVLPVKERALVLVKAYPQPSQKYEETVCCAGINDRGEFLRLYPIRYRHLPRDKQFERWDVLEFEGTRSFDDHRPESRHVNEDTICIVQHGNQIDELQRVRLWAPHVAKSLVDLRQDNQATSRSLGIVKPDIGSVKFKARKLSKDSADDTKLQELFRQVSLIERAALPELTIEYEFGYKFTCSGVSHDMKIHDWEVQAAYFAYKQRYGASALTMLQQEYEQNIPARNLHFVMGTMKAHPRQFIIIGLLRSSVTPEDVGRQASLI